MKKERFAIMLQAEGGRFCKFKRGERVKIIGRTTNTGILRNTVMIERLKWKTPKLPLMNQCYGIPKASIKQI